ncbi:EAL domain-containing protein [Guyparkeria sp.]|uniref:bifunctional diguanylate cyclase/phosphodiesterase n=1 Tax=Guyparkeria sp. TaxID=2035736 RepID=UPI0035658585
MSRPTGDPGATSVQTIGHSMKARDEQPLSPTRRGSASPLTITLLYVLYAGLWILFSDWLLELLIEPEKLARFGLFKGLAFVGVTSLLLYLMLRWLMPGAARRPASVRPSRHRPRASVHLTVFLANVAVVGTIVAGVYLNRAPAIIANGTSQLAAIAALKADQLSIWLDERVGDGRVLQKSNDFIREVERVVSGDGDQAESAREELVNLFAAMTEAYRYEGLALFAPDGQQLLNRGIETLPASIDAKLARTDGAIVRLPLAFDSHDHPHMDWLVPIPLETPAGERRHAWVLMRTNPELTILPLVHRPVSGHLTARTFLAKAESEHVLLLAPDEPDNPADAWPRQPWDESMFERSDFRAGTVARPFEGVNAKGAAVIGAAQPVPDTGWQVVSTIERDEALAPLRQALALLALVAFFLLTVMAMALLMLWRRTRESESLQLLARTAEQDRLLRVFYDMPFVGMAITSPESGRILQANPRMAEMLGHPGKTLTGKRWSELLQHAEGPDEAAERQELLAGQREQYRHEYTLMRPDGEPAWIQFDIRATRTEKGEAEYLVATAEDVTERRQAHLALQRQKDLYDFLSQTNQAITRCRTADELFATVCQVAVEHGRLAFAWIGRIDPDTGAVVPVARFGDETGYIDKIEVSVNADEPAGIGPVGRAVRKGRLEVVNHFQTEDDTAVWHDPAREAGVDAVAAFPIYRGGEAVATMALYAESTGFFDEAIRTTVDDLAADLSFALDHFDRLKDLEQAREAVRASPAVLFRWLPETGWPADYVSDNIEQWGYAAEQWYTREIRFADIIHPDDLPTVEREVEDFLDQGLKQYRQEYRLRMANGEYRWFEDVTRVHSDEQGQPLWLAGVVTDIQDRHEIEEHERLMAKVIENTHEGVLITDRDQVIIEVNPAFTELTGYSADEVVGHTPRVLESGQHGRAFYQDMWASLQSHGHWQGEIWNRRKNGEIYPEILSISAMADRDGSISHYVGLFVDITRQKENESKLDFLAHHDPLTGLPNRLLLVARLEQMIEVGRRRGENVALLMIDLDRFKDVNDSLGHVAGDQLLVKVSERLKARFDEADTIARLGGDEFAMALSGIDSAEQAGEVAGRVIAALGEPWELAGDQHVRILASVGITLFPDSAETPIELLQQADTALYRAKDEGRGTFRFFSDEMTDAARDRIDLELQLRRAIDNNELRLVFQPQIRVADRRLHGAEVLVRWQHPTQGLIGPERFIPVAETTGLIWPLGAWVLRETCRIGRRWLDEGRDFGRLAVNLSPHQLRHGRVDQLVAEALEESGLPPDHLELELTESAIVRRESEARRLIDRLRGMGVHVALDDFGTGYSSLGQLRQFALDVLKIDKRFVDLIEEPDDGGQIARVILELGHALGLEVVAEGVQNADQLAFLAAHGCDVYQGHLESRPLSAEAFASRYFGEIRTG